MKQYVLRVLGRYTMYQLVIRCLITLVSLAIVLSWSGLLPFNGLQIVAGALLAIGSCFTFNTILARVFRTTTNKESWLITALILSLIVGPISFSMAALAIVIASAGAMLSKFIFRWKGHHIFNPAATGVLVMTLTTGTGSSWWIGTIPLTIAVILIGLIVTHRTRRLENSIVFVISYVLLFFLVNGLRLSSETNLALIKTLLVNSPLIFFSTIMLIEPATSPNGRRQGLIYTLIVAVTIILFQRLLPAVQYSFEIGLLVGNLATRLIEPANNFVLTLVRNDRLTPSIESFFFETAPKIVFEPGQFLEWTLGHKDVDSRGIRRWFTIASAPCEPYVQLTTRFAQKSSSFKQALRQLKPGDRIVAHGLEGDFVLPKDKDAALVFIAGGIGITPFRSMIKELLLRKERRNITLVYAARSEEDLVFIDLMNEAKQTLGAQVIPILSEPGVGWQGRSGKIDTEFLGQEVPNIATSHVYISGPEPMVETLSTTIRDLGTPNHLIHQDFFPGYQASDVIGSRS